MSKNRDLGNYGSAALRDVGTSIGNMPEYTENGLSGLGYGGEVLGLNSDYNLVDSTQFFAGYNAANSPTSNLNDVILSLSIKGGNNWTAQYAASSRYNPNSFFGRTGDGAGVFEDWVEFYHNGNILGTVSQSGGVPTGAIIERGSNANGEYVKYADGTLICTRKTPDTVVSVSPTDGAVEVVSGGVSLPSNSVVLPTVKISAVGWYDGNSTRCYLNTLTVGEYKGWYSIDSNSFTKLGVAVEIANASINRIQISYLAIGRWY